MPDKQLCFAGCLLCRGANVGDKRRSRKNGREKLENLPDGVLMLICDLLLTIYDWRAAPGEASFLNHNHKS